MKASVAGAARKAKAEDKKMRKAMGNAKQTFDSYQNFIAKLGLGTDNLATGSTYGFNPVTRVRQLLEWIHRGTWIGGVAVDLVADDMTRGGVNIQGELKPDQISKIHLAATGLQIWQKLNETIQWSRLFGGVIAVMLIDGQDVKTPLRVDRIGPGQFKGLLVLDRWMVEPSLNDLVTELGPHLGLPKFYRVTMGQALVGQKVHYTRCIRLSGISLPYQQRLQENLWGLSVLERIYDRMVAFDSATTGAAQLVYKSYIRTYKIKDLRSVIASGGPVEAILIKYIDMMRRFQSIEGVTLIDGEDDFAANTHTAFAGISDALMQFGQQLSGALQIPLVRLFGQSPAGLNSTGESDLRTYYDNVQQQQINDLKIPVTTLYMLIAQSEGLQIDETFGIEFRPLWQLREKEKTDIATSTTDAVTKVFESGIIGRKTALQELKQSSDRTGIFSNITDEDIEAAEEEPAPELEEEGEGLPGEDEEEEAASEKSTHDNKFITPSAQALKKHHSLSAVIESPKGTMRRGPWGEAALAADYGFLRGTQGNDGDELDCFIGPEPESPNVFIIDQKHLRGPFDEHKILFGYYTQESALADYNASHNDDASRVMAISELTMPQFKLWLQNGDFSRPYGV